MKKWSSLWGMLLCATLLGSCSFSPEPYEVILLTKGNLKVDFWTSVYDGAQAAADLYGIELTFQAPSAEDNYDEQIAMLEATKDEDPDAIVFAASEYNQLSEPVQEVIDDGIPVVIVDSDVANENTVAYVGTDNEELGALLAENLCEYVKGEGKVGIVSFVKESHTAVLREEGFRKAMEGEERFELLETVYGNSDAKISQGLTAQLLEEHPDIVALVALNDPSIEGVCAALKRCPERKIQVFSIDCTPKQVPYIESGVIDVSLLQNPYQMGYYAVEVAYHYLEGDKTQADIYTDIYAANKDLIFEDLYQQLIFPFE